MCLRMCVFLPCRQGHSHLPLPFPILLPWVVLRKDLCAFAMALAAQVTHSLQDGIFQFLRPQNVLLLRQVQLSQPRSGVDSRVLVMTQWRAYIFPCRQPVKVESSFSYLEISAITVGHLYQLAIETDRQNYSFTLMTMEDLETVVRHVTTSLKKIFPDSSPGRLLKKVPMDLQDQLRKLTTSVEEQLNGTQGPCGGFSETYAALCDFNEFPCREEVKWDVDNIYHVQNCRDFNLMDFSHLDSQDVALAVAALSFNHWFTRISNRDSRVSPEVQEQILYMINRSPRLEEVCLESSGLRPDFAQRMACALRDHTGSVLHTINLSANPIEDKGVVALSQQLEKLPQTLTHLSLSKVSLSPKGVASLAQAFSLKSFSTSLHQLDLSGNAGCLATEEATCLFTFLSRENAVSYLDLSGTDCPLDTLFVSLSAGCCSKMAYLSLSRNTFSHRKAKEVTRSVRDFFSRSEELKYVGLAGTRLPADALRLMLQGLATNTHLTGLEVDLSSCELRSAGAQVIQEHIFEAKAISSLDLSDNGLESDMVTLILSIGRSHSIRHLALGRNFAMKSRALSDVLHRIVQLIQEEECPIESLSVSDSKLKTGTTILINSLGRNLSLTTIDISGNCIGDTGAKMLAKALLINTRLRTLVWDRNNVTAAGLTDVANALEKNSTLQTMSLPMSDLTQAYRSNPEKTEEALNRIQAYLHRNSQQQEVTSDHVLQLQQALKTTQSEKLVEEHCLKVQEVIRPLSTLSLQDVQSDILCAEEALHHARTSVGLLPTLFEVGRAPPSSDMLQHVLRDAARVVTNEVVEDIQELMQTMLQRAQSVCPRVVQRLSVSEQLTSCMARMSRQAAVFLQEALVEQASKLVRSKLSELRQTVSISLAESIITEVIQDLSVSQQKLERHIKEYTQPVSGCSSATPRANIPQLRVMEAEFPTDEYVPVSWSSGFPTGSIRPAPSVKSLLDAETDSQQYGENQLLPDAGGAAMAGGGWALAPQSVTVGQARPRPLNLPQDAASHLAPQDPDFIDSPMELPVEGQRLNHYTHLRPRPQRTHRQVPTKTQHRHTTKGEYGTPEDMSRVDEGVEEFFSKKVIADSPQTLKGMVLPMKAGHVEEGGSTHSKDRRRKFGDFFAFKKLGVGWGRRAEGAPEDHRMMKNTSIVELIRPLREAARADRDRRRDKERLLQESAPQRPVTAPGKTQSPTPAAAPSVATPATSYTPPPALERRKSRTPDTKRKLGTPSNLRDAKSQSLILLPVAHSSGCGTTQLSGFPSGLEHAQYEGITKTTADPLDTKADQEAKGELLRLGSEDPSWPLRPPVTRISPNWLPPPNRPCPLTPPRPGVKFKDPPVTISALVVPNLPSSSREPPPPPAKHSPIPSPRREAPPIPLPQRVVTAEDGRDRAQSITEAMLPQPRPRTKPASHRRAVSVHEEALYEQMMSLDPQVLREARPQLQRLPVRKRTHPRDLPPYSEDQGKLLL
ncbi:F-actin-uncapping protein LRRC16A-like isoform X2 [Scleropages formosus]|uniref:F-actin-uncapping protein LRRC16A-like isoform X2 n=1 Tax=Scleropages formosus TaxID=113540 RepID=UPI0008790803|nr:F-actin-uncapping protein LRRC16A-like isoform X2 [Scleropages formosus]